MKKLSFVLFACLFGYFLSAQQVQQAPVDQAPYLRFPTVPPFHILKIDSATYYTKDDLKKHRRTLIMCFSPECDHCKHQTEDLLAAISKFKDIEIVMATFQPFPEMKEFYNYYRIADHPNIKMGRDEKYVLPPFYKIKSLPYLALYDSKGDLITTFEGNQKIEKLLSAFNAKEKRND